jgi:hypothetical protein
MFCCSLPHTLLTCARMFLQDQSAYYSSSPFVRSSRFSHVTTAGLRAAYSLGWPSLPSRRIR